MTRDVLNQARSHEVSRARFRLGDYEFRKPDYRQILRWAEELEMTPELLLEGLERGDPRGQASLFPEDEVNLIVEDGAIKELSWYRDNLNFFPGISEKGLIVRSLSISGYGTQITELDLSAVPELEVLSCTSIQLTELDLSPVPKLTSLVCYNNQLTELDLSGVPELEVLLCDTNHLTELDLSPVPKLEGLYCSNNRLTELDLSSVAKLIVLYCDNNQLTKLDLSAVPELEELSCHSNQLTELDFAKVSNLSFLEDAPDRGVRLKNAPRWMDDWEDVSIISYAYKASEEVSNWPEDIP